MFDKAKLRLMAGAGGALLGFASVLFLALGLAVFLSEYIGWTGGAIVVGAILLCLSILALAYFIAPFKDVENEVSQFEEATADALADLPFDTIKALVEKRPVTALSVAALIGYSTTRDPGNAVKNAERMVMSIL